MTQLVSSYVLVMTCVVLLLCLAAVVAYGWSAWLLPQHRELALVGLVAMALSLIAAICSMLLHALLRGIDARLSTPPTHPLHLTRLIAAMHPMHRTQVGHQVNLAMRAAGTDLVRCQSR